MKKLKKFMVAMHERKKHIYIRQTYATHSDLPEM